ncbi:ankyrin repeats (3 copies) domain-containing protein [Ditylenchus destructor]|nr:ankyrin repeats (3 copies) domain-containing protein [Ditylenchus destructor]
MNESDPAEKLRHAAREGSLDDCRDLLAQHPNIVNEKDPDDATALYYACSNGHLDIVKLLVENGADIEQKGPGVRVKWQTGTPLMAACWGQHAEVVEYLLSVGARINRKSLQGTTALHDAVENGDHHLVSLLLKAGATQQKDRWGCTPLRGAAFAAHGHLFSLLLNNVSAQEEWDAWKLRGAVFVEVYRDITTGLEAWRRAVSREGISELIANGELKVNIDRDNPEKARVYGGYPKEATTVDEVERLSGNNDAIHIQALLIRERVLGQSNPSTHTFLDRRAWQLCENGQWAKAGDLWMYLMKMLGNCYAPMGQNASIYSWRRPIMALRCILEENKEDLHPRWGGDETSRMECREQIKLEYLVEYLGFIVGEMQRYIDVREKLEKGETEGMTREMQHLRPLSGELCEKVHIIITDLIYIISRLYQENLFLPSDTLGTPRAQSSQTKCNPFWALLQRAKVLMERINPDIGVFYTACQYCATQKESESTIFVLKQLLEVEKEIQNFRRDLSLWRQHGVMKETPLHAVVRAWSPENDQYIMKIVQLLLEEGAPLLAKDSNNVMCWELLQKCLENNSTGHILPIGKFISLKQIAAVQLRNALTGANYRQTAASLLPQHLCDFIQIF